MPFLIVRNDITEMKVDAIVNTANALPIVGSGIDKAVYEKAGWQKLLEARKAIGKIEVGKVAVTPAFDLEAKYIIHAVSPKWQGGACGEAELLAECYCNILKTATKEKFNSVAIPLISTGNMKFPKDKALKIAKEIIGRYLQTHNLLVYLVVFDAHSFKLSEELFQKVNSYIDERYVAEREEKEYRHRFYSFNLRETLREDSYRVEKAICLKSSGSTASAKNSRSLDDIMEELEAGFAETLFKYIDAKGLTDPQVYKRANLDRKLFSKIRKNKNYKPSKNTALALAIALELNLDETKDFIGKAGFALTSSSKTDLIVEFYIEQNNYDIFELNEVLFRFEEPLLGSNVA